MLLREQYNQPTMFVGSESAVSINHRENIQGKNVAYVLKVYRYFSCHYSPYNKVKQLFTLHTFIGNKILINNPEISLSVGEDVFRSQEVTSPFYIKHLTI